MEYLLIAIVIGLVPAFIAKAKGHSFFVWWVYGALVFIIALPMALLLKTDQDAIKEREAVEGLKRCPYCAETIRAEAIVCRFCNRNLQQSPAQQEDA